MLRCLSRGWTIFVVFGWLAQVTASSGQGDDREEEETGSLAPSLDRQDLVFARAFYDAIAVPHLGLTQDDTAVRVHQSFYRCAKPTLAFKSTLTEVTRSRWPVPEPMSDLDFIYQCAKGMLTTVSTGLFTQTSSIPVIFQIQLIHQTMLKFDGALESLMQLFGLDTNPTVRATLERRLLCHRVQNMLFVEKSFSQISDTFVANSAAATSCFVGLTREVHTTYIHDHDVVDIFDSISYDFRHSIMDYTNLQNVFCISTLGEEMLTNFIESGLNIHSAIPYCHREFYPLIFGASPIQSYLTEGGQPPVLLELLKVGWDIHRRSGQPSYGDIILDVVTSCNSSFEVPRFLLEHGFDINHEGFGAKHHRTLLSHAYYLREWGPDTLNPDCIQFQFLLENGADVLVKDSRFFPTLLMRLYERHDLDLLRLFVRLGRPQLNHGLNEKGETHAHFLAHHHPDTVRHLVEEGGLRLNPTPSPGVRASRAAWVRDLAARMARNSIRPSND